MTEVILDPEDSRQAIVGVHTGETYGDVRGATVIHNVHDPARCAGRGCVIHHPSDHHMRSWQLVWRGDKHVMERTCPHGVGHPDPDDAAYLVSAGRSFETVHGCDGCCRG